MTATTTHQPPTPELPDDVTHELVTALAALTHVETAWRAYRAAADDAAAAAQAGGRLDLRARRRDLTVQMLPAEPGAAIAAAQQYALVLAAMTAAHSL